MEVDTVPIMGTDIGDSLAAALFGKAQRAVLPVVKESGGYIFFSDHSVPSSVSLANFRRIVELAKDLGGYD
jgi:hypothetical protein